MYFNSYIFVLLFLPLVVIGYYLLNGIFGRKIPLLFLVGMSLWFYGFLNPRYLILLLGSIAVNYILHLVLESRRWDENRKTFVFRRSVLLFGVAGNVAVLALLKYFNFFVENLNGIFHSDFSVHSFLLPIGISFITFQQIAFLVDSFRRETGKCNLIEYMLFITFFPHITSGPIITHEQFFPLLSDPARKKVNWDRLGQGLYLFSMGMGKKVLIADMYGNAVNWAWAEVSSLNTTSAFLVTVFYSVQIYFDFSGYSDMAIGISRMLNLDLPVNFDSPYQGDTILDFWKRWHISLTRFLTKYIYIPLGGNRKGRMRTALNTMVVFLCSGIWHGADWTFVLWGALHGCAMVFTKELRSVIEKVPRALIRLLTFLFVDFAWVLFRADSFETAGKMYRAVFSGGGRVSEELCSFFSIPLLNGNFGEPVWLTMGVITAAVLFEMFFGKNALSRAESMKYNFRTGAVIILVLFLSLLKFSNVGAFIYFDF